MLWLWQRGQAGVCEEEDKVPLLRIQNSVQAKDNFYYNSSGLDRRLFKIIDENLGFWDN